MRNPRHILGIVLLIIGIGAVVYGVVEYTNLRQTFGFQVRDGLDDISEAFGGRRSGPGERSVRLFVIMGAGAASAVIGGVIVFRKKRKR